MTVYDVDTRCLIATDQDKAAIRSLMDKPQANANGSYDLYFGSHGSGGEGRPVGQDDPGQRLVVRLPHLRPTSSGLRQNMEAQ